MHKKIRDKLYQRNLGLQGLSQSMHKKIQDKLAKERKMTQRDTIGYNHRGETIRAAVIRKKNATEPTTLEFTREK
ncbi:hypothetical protein C1H46_045375 [Malus baccata]|uniref:Uncharacterized protein n=1 Tax=Malus baccata TaxID=106549 RepID=A0A540K5D2_MALBA|nr:hypothetical protein C1H46_045375 [Malus baccata]